MDERQITFGDPLASTCLEYIGLTCVKEECAIERTGKTPLELPEPKTRILVLDIIITISVANEDVILPDSETMSREEEQEKVVLSQSWGWNPVSEVSRIGVSPS